MEKEKLNKLNVKLEKEIDEDIIEILEKVQNKTLFTKTAIRLAYQQMIEDPNIARVREPLIFKWDKFIKDVEDNKNNTITVVPYLNSTHNKDCIQNNEDVENKNLISTDEELDDEELF